MPPAENLTRHSGHITREQRESLLGQRGAVLWLTGLSGSGKSTLAYALEQQLVAMGRAVYVLDGDNVRHGLNSDLGFSPEARDENIRRVGETAALFADAGILAIAGFISPYRAHRDRARLRAGARFVEIYLDVPVTVCEERDPKGLYKRARAGEITQFTGVSAPYEPPDNPELRIDTHRDSVEVCATTIVTYLEERGLLRGPEQPA